MNYLPGSDGLNQEDVPVFLPGLIVERPAAYKRGLTVLRREKVCVGVFVGVGVGGGTEDSPKVGDGVSLSWPPSPSSTCPTSLHTHTSRGKARACLAMPCCLHKMTYCDLYGKLYKCTVLYTVVARGRSVGFSLMSLKPIFSESAPLPEHHPYISFDFLSFLFLWTDFYSPCQTPWSNFVRFFVHLYSLPYHTTFPLSGLVPRPRRWLE